MTTLKADQYFASAEKKLSKFDWFGMSKQQIQEDAAELFKKAAAQYKMCKDYNQAGLSYERAATCDMAADNGIEAKQSWRESGKCYRHSSPQKAQNSYKNAIQLNLESDRYGQAARLQEEIGQMLLEDDYLEEAIAAFEQSADYYEAENDTGNKNKRLLKVAHMCGNAKQWQKAIDIYENTANASCDNNLLRWKVKEYCFKAMLLQLCKHADIDKEKDNVNWGKVLQINEKYGDISDIYASSRECKLINALLTTLPTEILDFKDAVSNFDRISRLEPWCTSLLLHVQTYMESKTRAKPTNELMGGGNDNNYNDNDNSNNNNSTFGSAADAPPSYDDTNNNDHNTNSNNNSDAAAFNPQSNPFDQAKLQTDDDNNNNNSNTTYDAAEIPDLSGARPDADLL